MVMSLMDAQSAEAFLIPQLSYIEREVYIVKYPQIRYPELVPIDTSAPEWIPSVTYFSMDGVGAANWFSARAQDVPLATGAQNGQTNSTLWVNKTPDQILFDVNNLLSGIWITTQTIEMADTLLMPLAAYTYITTTRLSNLSDMTILEWMNKANAFTSETGRPLTIRGIRGLDTAGSGGTGRLVAYWRDPGVVKMHLPMPFRFLPEPFRTRPLYWEIPGIFRFGGVDIRRPSAFRYLDGI
jgi:hypothetical protein